MRRVSGTGLVSIKVVAESVLLTAQRFQFGTRKDPLTGGRFPVQLKLRPHEEIMLALLDEESLAGIREVDFRAESFEGATEILTGMPSPRLLRTHLPVQLLPKSFWESKCKVIYVARNGKDVAVSDYHFSLAQVYRTHPGSWTQYLDNFMLGNVDFGPWYEHVKSWWEKRNELQLLYLFYEDMKEDLKGVIKKLLAFLQKDMEEKVIEKIIHHTSFHAMKENTMTNYKTVANNLLDQTISPFMRKGICGDWKNHFTVAQNERFDEEYARQMSGSSLSFRTEI